MSVFNRILLGIVCVGLTSAALCGLFLCIGVLADNENTWLTKLGVVLIIIALFIQGYTSGGDNNSETKSAD
ncbi:hypothetical protein [Paenibacillus sp. FSL R5-0519]|uniref:hypothetical protein n=1 Tax=Paenibacillus sp. FSL R5-0519 TaxID=2921648 RepID=UPI0030DCB334